MARTIKKKKLNRKLITVLLIVAVPLLLIMAIAWDSRRPFLPSAIHKMLGRDPQVLLEQGRAGLTELESYYAELKGQVRAIDNPKEAAEKWKVLFKDDYSPRARDVYALITDARRFSKNNLELQIDAHKEMVRFHLITDNYTKGALPSWETIVRLDGTNYEAWKNIADLYMEMADTYSGIETLTKLDEAAVELTELKPEDASGQSMRLFALAMKLKSALSQDIISDKETADALLAEVQEKFSDSVIAAKAAGCYYAYQVQSAANLAAKQEILNKSAGMLKSAIEANPESPQAYKNYFRYYLEVCIDAYKDEFKVTLDGEKKNDIMRQLAEFKTAAISEYNVALLKFPDNAELKVSKANFLSSTNESSYQEVASLYEQAVALEPDNLIWTSVLGKLNYFVSAETGDKQILNSARKQLQKTYYSYDDSMTLAPKGRMVSYYRQLEVMPFLALIDTQLAGTDESAVKELEAIAVEFSENKGSTNVLTKACEGLHFMALGKDKQAIQRLYSAVANQQDNKEFSTLFLAEIRWKLFELLRGGDYKVEALQNAILSFNVRARSGADLVSILDTYTGIPSAKAYQEVVQLIQMFGGRYEKDAVSYPEIRRHLGQALLRTGKDKEARSIIADISTGGFDLEFLRCELIEDEAQKVAALEELAGRYPAESKLVNYLYSYYINGMKNGVDNLAKLRALLKAAHEAAPDDRYYTQELAKVNESDPLAISPERMFEINLSVIEGIKDEFDRALAGGRLYASRAELQANKAEQAESVKADRLKAVELFAKAAELKPDSVAPLTETMIVYMGMKDYAKAESIAKKIKAVDDQAGIFAEVDILYANEEYESAERQLSTYLSENPLSARGHHVLARIYQKSGRRADAIRELELSLSQNKYNADAIVDYIIMLNEDYVSIGLDNIGPDKIQSMMSWIEQLMSVSSGNIQGVRFFIQYAPLWAGVLDDQLYSPNTDAATAETYRETILRIEDMLLRNITAITNSLRGNESIYTICANSMQAMSKLESLQEKHQAYMDMIDKFYQQVMAEMPGSSVLISNYELFSRGTGRGDSRGIEKLQEILNNSTGAERFAAVMALTRFYMSDGKDNEVVSLLTGEIDKATNADERLSMRGILASVYKNTGNYDKAIEVYTQQRKEKDSDELMTLQIEAMMDGGYNEQAQPLLAEMEKNYPDDNKVYLLKAKYALRETEYDKAIEYADKALELKPGKSVGLQIKSQALFYSDKLYEAQQVIGEMRAGVSADSNMGRALLAQIYLRTRKYDDAIIEMNKGLDSQPGDVQLKTMLVNTLENLRRWNDLVEFYLRQTRIFPDRYDNYAGGARVMLTWARELSAAGDKSQAELKLTGALALLDKSIASANDRGVTSVALIDARLEILLELGRYDEVVKDINSNNEMVKVNPQLLLRKAQALVLSGVKDEAMEVIGSLIDKFSQGMYVELLVEKIVAIVDPVELISWSDANYDKVNNKSVLTLVRAAAARNAGKMAEYLASSEKARELARGDEELSFVASSRLAIACIQNEKYNEAIDIYRELCQQVPSNYSLLNNLAYALLEVGGNQKEALEVARKAYSIARLEPMVLDTYGMALLQNNQPDQARQLFSKAIQELQRNNSEVPVEFEYHLAQSLIASGRSEEAAEMLEDLLRRARLSQSAADVKMADKVESLLNTVK